jgi:hypothetical protein
MMIVPLGSQASASDPQKIPSFSDLGQRCSRYVRNSETAGRIYEHHLLLSGWQKQQHSLLHHVILRLVDQVVDKLGKISNRFRQRHGTCHPENDRACLPAVFKHPNFKRPLFDISPYFEFSPLVFRMVSLASNQSPYQYARERASEAMDTCWFPDPCQWGVSRNWMIIARSRQSFFGKSKDSSYAGTGFDLAQIF